MRIFVTGASGFVGSAVVRDLISSGHEVVGLARSDAAAKLVTEARANVYRGDLEKPESLTRGASESDAIIHTGFIHDFSHFKANCELDRKVIDVLGSAITGSKRPFIVTSAIGVLPSGGIATEQTMPFESVAFPSEDGVPLERYMARTQSRSDTTRSWLRGNPITWSRS
jgi:nucleoside-diphosphate-sugar epimerase